MPPRLREARLTLTYPNARSVSRNMRRHMSVQAPELLLDHREEPTEPLRGQIRGKGLELPAGSSTRWERMADHES